MKLVKNVGNLRYRTSLNYTVLLINNTACNVDIVLFPLQFSFVPGCPACPVLPYTVPCPLLFWVPAPANLR